jgi:predicted nucleic acid-binding protein
VVVADTSFLFSLFGRDTHTGAAQLWARQARQPIAVSVLAHFEFDNAIRFAAFRKASAQADALNSLAAFEADLKAGNLHRVPCDLADVVAEAARLSSLHTLNGGHRSFDILHVATASVLKAATFLTFDANQRRLATSQKLVAGP